MQRSQRSSHSLETPSISSAEQTSRSSEGYSSHASSSSGGRGRAQISGWLRSLNGSSSEESRDSSLAIGHGRGAIPKLIRKLGQPSTSSIPESISKDDSEGVLGKLADISVYDNPSSPENLQSLDDIAPICRQGKSGT
ncbi:PREDICTED: uncharacterized protein LOC108770638, partial [Trachymyrmex cornetzi]|uniref:uncharacterized protein LOC108770638 n=1 Tax=Trachymyrmex cornetzi TaxID=471704 RepID=UPI00084EED9F